jgi:hypothetical protein
VLAIVAHPRLAPILVGVALAITSCIPIRELNGC